MTDERLEELVAEFIERREGGESLDPAAFAAEHPSADGLADALDEALGAEALFPSGVGSVDRPEHIGPWRVTGELGRGGGGRVFQVVHDGRQGEFALKLLNLAAVGNPRALERFQREGKVLTSLDHPGIVKVHEVSGEGELPFIVMDLLPGQALSVRLALARREQRTSRANRTPPTDVLRLPGEGDTIARAVHVVARLARAVQHAHERGLLHRDLKPSNVLLDADGEPVLVDFGLAVSEESATLTESGDLLGTPHYMAPEQARGERADARTDVYGLAAVLYELLTLRPPHQGRDPLEVLQHIRTRPHVPVRRLNASVPPALARVVDRALAWNRARRTASAAALAQDLDAALVGAPVSARGRGLVERAEDLLRFRPRAVMSIALAGLLLVLVAVLATRGGDRSERIEAADRAAQVAWLESDEGALTGHAQALHGLASDDPRAALYLARAQERIADPTGDRAVDALIEGLHASREGRDGEALAAFARAYDAAPRWALPLGLSGLIESEDDQGGRRIADLEVATRLLPESQRLARELAILLRRAGRSKEGVALLERVLADGVGDWHEWSELAACRLEAGDAPGAFDAIEEALRRGGDAPDPNLLSRKASILDGLGDRANAESLFRELSARYPRDPHLHFKLAVVIDRGCRLPEAREEYLRAHELDPRDFKPILALAHLHAGSGLSNPVPCERCERVFTEHPELLDPVEALRWVKLAIDMDRCRTVWVPRWAADTARRIDRLAEVRAILAAQIDEQAPVDERVVRIERELRALDSDLAARGEDD